MRIYFFIIILSTIFAFVSFTYAEANSGTYETSYFGKYNNYEIGKVIVFEDLAVSYRGSVVEAGNSKFTSDIFELAIGSDIKKITLPFLDSSMIVRFGAVLYVLRMEKHNRTFTIEKGLNAAASSKFEPF